MPILLEDPTTADGFTEAIQAKFVPIMMNVGLKNVEVKLFVSGPQRHRGGEKTYKLVILTSATEEGAWPALRQEAGWATEPG
jgi:hypothetical protein